MLLSLSTLYFIHKVQNLKLEFRRAATIQYLSIPFRGNAKIESADHYSETWLYWRPPINAEPLVRAALLLACSQRIWRTNDGICCEHLQRVHSVNWIVAHLHPSFMPTFAYTRRTKRLKRRFGMQVEPLDQAAVPHNLTCQVVAFVCKTCRIPNHFCIFLTRGTSYKIHTCWC